MHSHIDFAYPLYLTYGHLMLASVGLALCMLIWFMKWPRLTLIPFGAFTLWAASASVMVFTGLNLTAPMDMPSGNFAKGSAGKILDMGAGTGRSTIMLLETYPKSTVTALDLFTDSYEEHFGKGFSGQEKLLSNLKAAGVEQRAIIQPGDMRKLPFESAAFDAVFSSYALDHLGHDGATAALNEASRVLKPGGEFLMMVIAKDAWLTYTFGPLLMHARMRAASTWPNMMKAAGLDVTEEGKRPATLFYVARKRP